MTEPWANDFRALRAHSRQDAPSLERTRQLVLASATEPETDKEKPMTFLKRRPALALAIALALIAVLTPVAYAVVDRVFLSIDPDQPEEKIEEDVRRQLEAAGIQPSAVTADKDGGNLAIGIEARDPAAWVPDLDIAIKGGGEGATMEQRQVQIAVACELSPAQVEALTDIARSDEFVAPLRDRVTSDAELAAAMRALFAAHGFKDTEVTVAGDRVSVTVKSPPS